MTDLKPCPFCGGEAKRSIETFERTILSWIYCTNCGAAGGYRPTEAEAIAAWNTRAERTCRAELNEERNAITCSECGSIMLLKGWEEFHDWTGTTRISTFTTYPHCPNCGARVVGE